MKMALLPQIIYLCIVYSIGSNKKENMFQKGKDFKTGF